MDRKKRAQELDAIIGRGAKAYIEFGMALKEMHDGKFYTEFGYTSGVDGWKAYCIEKRNLTMSYAYYHIEAFKISTIVENHSLPAPKTECHARELYPLRDDETKLVSAYSDFLELDEKTQTAKALGAIVDGYRDIPDKPLPSGKFSIILADPPWRMEFPFDDTGRSVEDHYHTMSLEGICRLGDDIKERATDDAVLFLWSTMPKLDWAIKVIDAWGFQYRTGAVWVKDKIGLGYYLREQHELLLIARRGKYPMPDKSSMPSSVIDARRGRHSDKPEVAYELIEMMFPDGNKIELFARRKRNGWTSWGEID